MITYSETYAEYATNPALRSGRLIAYLTSPRLMADMNAGLVQRKSKALSFGTAGHMSVLEPVRFSVLAVTQPEEYQNEEGKVKPWSNNANVCKAWHAEQRALGKVVVSAADHARLTLMHARMPAVVREIFADGKPEATVRAALSGVACQCRVDWLRLAERQQFEFKTILNADSIETHLYRFRYYIQQRFYARILEAETGERFKSRIVFAETNPPFRWRIVELDLDYLALADQAIDEALPGISARIKSGEWDDPEDITVLASPPAWLGNDLTLDDDEAA